MSVLSPALPENAALRRATGTPQVVLIYNTTSGAMVQGSGWGLGPLLPGPPDDKPHPPAWLEDAQAFIRAETGTEPKIVATETQDEAIETVKDAARQGVPLVIAAGGDGTLRTAATHLADTETALGIIPHGTVNVFARELGIALDDALGAVKRAVTGQVRRVDMGCIHLPGAQTGQLFLLMASLGVDAVAVEGVNKAVKDVVGAGAYVLSGLSTLAGFVAPKVTLHIAGADIVSGASFSRVSEPFAVLVMNSGLYGGDFRAIPDARIDDGLLDVLVFDTEPDSPATLQRATYARQFGIAAMGRHKDDESIHYVRAARIEIVCEPGTALQVDGDSCGSQERFIIETMPGALAVRC